MLKTQINNRHTHTNKHTITNTYVHIQIALTQPHSHTLAQARFGEKLIEILNLLGTCAAAKYFAQQQQQL